MNGELMLDEVVKSQLNNLIALGQDDGFITDNDLLTAMSSIDAAHPITIDDAINYLSDNGIAVLAQTADQNPEEEPVEILDDKALNDFVNDVQCADSTKQYLREIGAYSLFTPEEEREITARVRSYELGDG